MFNATFIKQIRAATRHDPLLSLSDGIREEGNSAVQNKLVRFVTNLQSYYVVKHYRRSDARRFANAIFRHQASLQTMTDAMLVDHFYHSISQLNQNAQNAKHLALAFACIGEGIYRHFGFYPHDVQYLGASILLQGKLAEMQTGEGKTIVAAIAAILAAASGAAVHVLSTNEYLATRDREEMQPVFDFFKLSSGSVTSEMEIAQRQVQYRQAICYVSASELVFDVLKDELNASHQLSRRKANLYQYLTASDQQDSLIVPALHFCIVDEADSVLIDEASTPLIISQEGESIMEEAMLTWALAQAQKLHAPQHYQIDWTHRDIILFIDTVHPNYPVVPLPAEVKPMWHSPVWQQLLIKKALTALHLFMPNEQYIIAEDKVVIVDEATGRPMPDRTWEQGLHQLIEIKAQVPVSKPRQTIAQITFQRFFKRYLLLSGLTGTVSEVSREMWHVYGLKVCVIPPNQHNRRRALALQCFKTPTEKWQAVAMEARSRVAAGQPVLIGTRSVEASETVLAALQQQTQMQIQNDNGRDKPAYRLYLLNARQNAEEAQIVAQAGQSGTITIATNMAGRGTDIKLDTQAKHHGGLHVILTEHHDSKRIDRQLIGRSARQGNAGSYREMVCFNDAILISNPTFYQKLGTILPGAWLKRWCYRQALRVAQRRAQQRQYAIRMNTLKQDQNRQKQIGFIGQLK